MSLIVFCWPCSTAPCHMLPGHSQVLSTELLLCACSELLYLLFPDVECRRCAAAEGGCRGAGALFSLPKDGC
jgi:hypothetical protein